MDNCAWQPEIWIAMRRACGAYSPLNLAVQVASRFNTLLVMTDSSRRAQVIEAHSRDHPALVVELAKLHLAAEPDDRTVLLLYGDALVGLARYSEARAAYERALALSIAEERTSALRLLGHLYDARYEVREAERYYGEAIAAAPTDASAFIYLGALLAKTGRLEEAEAMHLRATQCASGEIGEAYLNLGLVQRGRGNYIDALASLRRALAIDPADSAAMDALADIERLLFEFPSPEA